MIFRGKITMSTRKSRRNSWRKIQHSFGHGVGLEVHEYPALSSRSKGTFSENMIVTAEPGVYRSGSTRHSY